MWPPGQLIMQVWLASGLQVQLINITLVFSLSNNVTLHKQESWAHNRYNLRQMNIDKYLGSYNEDLITQVMYSKKKYNNNNNNNIINNWSEQGSIIPVAEFSPVQP